MWRTEVHLHFVCVCGSVYAHTCHSPHIDYLWPQSHHRNRITDTLYCAWLYVGSEDSDSGSKLACYKFYPLTHISKPQAPHFLGQSLPLNLELTVPPRPIKHFTTELSPGNCTISSNSALKPLRPTCLCLSVPSKGVWNQACEIKIRLLFSDLFLIGFVQVMHSL